MSYWNAIAAFDLDGTLLNDEKQIANDDLQTLVRLEKNNILRVAATGRNHHSIYRVLSNSAPIDFVIFSSGAGIMNWKTGEILFTRHLSKERIKQVIEIIHPYHLSYTIHKAIPNTHSILYFKNEQTCDDLWQYANYYKSVENHNGSLDDIEFATQMILQFHHQVELFDVCRLKLDFVKTIRSTSPINHQSRWMEIFHPDVSKGNGLSWLMSYLSTGKITTFGIGNDFNDVDLLDFTDHRFVVDNANPLLKGQYQSTASNNQQGFSKAIAKVFGI